MLIPSRFLQLLVHDVDPVRGVTGLCAGYERTKWRHDALAKHIIDWIPDFALSSYELSNIGPGNLVDLIRKATKAIYETEKFQLRGEFGEIILHGLMRDIFQSITAVKKIYFQDGNNEVIKGFDAVHVVVNGDELELWLGESKFYEDINDAIRDVIAELKKHLATDYLRGEFAAITNKLDREWDHFERLSLLLKDGVSLDDVFQCIRIPVLLTYDSRTVGVHTSRSDAYKAAFSAEIARYHGKFVSQLNELEKAQGFGIRIHLFLLPLKAKKELLANLDARLKSAQSI